LNPNRADPDDDGVYPNTKAGAEYHFLEASTMAPGLFIDPLLGMSCLFTRIDVIINNEKIEFPSLEEFGFAYHAINRRFTTDDFCKEKYGETIPRIGITTDRQATAATATPALKRALQSLNFDSYNATNPILGSFGFDGVFPFSSQSNILAALMKKKIENGFLRPGTRITLRLYKRSTLNMMLDSTVAADAGYYSDADFANPLPEPEFELVDLKLAYESFVPDARALAGFAKGIPKYYVDVPRFRFASVPSGQMVTTHELDIPKGTKALIVGWAHNSALWYSEAKNLNTRFRFIPEAKEIKMKMNGVEGFIMKEGLQNLGLLKHANYSPTARLYHSSLVQKGLYDRNFETMFPRTDDPKSYDQVLIIDLTDRTIAEDTTMTLTTLYTNALSPANFNLFYITLQQYLFTHQPNNKWKYDLVD
jgi:hypothetical protein